jgi:hypothetical protein
MQNNEQTFDLSTVLQNMASLLTEKEVKSIKVSQPLFVYMSYFLQDTISYEKGVTYPVGYIYGTPIEIDNSLSGFEWEPVYQQEKGMKR